MCLVTERSSRYDCPLNAGIRDDTAEILLVVIITTVRVPDSTCWLVLSSTDRAIALWALIVLLVVGLVSGGMSHLRHSS